MHPLATNLSSIPVQGFRRIFERGGALVGKHSQMLSRRGLYYRGCSVAKAACRIEKGRGSYE